MIGLGAALLIIFALVLFLAGVAVAQDGGGCGALLALWFAAYVAAAAGFGLIERV